MAIVPVAAAYGSLVELEDIGSSVESLARLVESQKELFHSQIDQLQKIVVTQCKLTGANPLAQEMAAGALSIKIGKRPRDLLNPKAVKYMQSLFSIKDTIGKKETREISAFCGITVTQVRDYFSSQRAKVRKLVRMSHEKATKCDESKTAADECSISPLQSVPPGEDIPVCTSDFSTVGDCTQISRNSGNITSPCTQSPPTPENTISVCTQLHGNPSNGTLVCPQVPGSFGNVTSVRTQIPVYPGNFTTVCAQVPGHIGNFSAVSAPVPANSGNITNVFTPILGYSEIVTAVGTLVPGSILNVTPVQDGQLAPTKANVKAVEEGPSKSLVEETTPGVDSDDKKFLENIFNLMRKEQTFSGREKLLEWVLQIHNSAVLSWFLTKGGITILAGWLSEAALEEQTTLLLIIFKVLCHLPLNKAQPVQMSDILKTVNKLRFYRSSDISNRAKVLLARWSKMFFRSQAQKISRNSLKSGQKETIRNKQRTNEVLGDESWQLKLDIPEEILALAESAEDSRETEPKKGLKLLTESSDGSSRKHCRNVSATKTIERRKVLLVEHPDSKAGRSLPTARAVPSNNSRPMSADDIQKAKMRASFMQDKYGKSNSPASENIPQKTEGQKVPPASLPESRKPHLPQLRRNEVKKFPTPTTKGPPHKSEASKNLKPSSTSQEQLEKLKKNQIQWRTPPEVRLNSSWRVSTGENSKEVQVQTQRNKREKEMFYPNPQDVPLNPKEPWDVEMDFDDSLIPEIPIDQPSDLESPVCSPTVIDSASNANVVANGSPSTSSVAVTAAAPPTPATAGRVVLEPEPDTELLEVLLKHPDVVEVLTKGEGRNLSSEQMVALLDMLKKVGTGAADVLNRPANIPIEGPREPEPEQFSLPSPTPPSNAATRTVWRSEFPSQASTSVSQPQPQFVGNRGAPFVPTVSPSPPLIPKGVNNQTAAALAVNHHTRTMAPQTPAALISSQQLTVAASPLPQQHQPVPNLLPTRPPPMYAPMQQSRVPETIIPPNHYPVNHPSIPLNPPPHSEPPAFLPKTPARPPADNAAGFSRRDPVPDYWDGGGRLDDPATNSNYYANHNNYNNNSHNNTFPRRNEYAPRLGMGTWSLEGSPAVDPPEFQEYPYDREYLELRRDQFDHRSRHDWPRQRQWDSGQRSHYQGGGGGGRRWRDRGRGR